MLQSVDISEVFPGSLPTYINRGRVRGRKDAKNIRVSPISLSLVDYLIWPYLILFFSFFFFFIFIWSAKKLFFLIRCDVFVYTFLFPPLIQSAFYLEGSIKQNLINMRLQGNLSHSLSLFLALSLPRSCKAPLIPPQPYAKA